MTDHPPGDNEQQKAASEAGDGGATRTPIAHEVLISHLHHGYDNSQATTRFLDTKASAVIGFVPLLFTLEVGLFRVLPAPLDAGMLTASSQEIFFLKTLWVAAVLLGIGCLITGGFAITQAFGCLSPRDTGDRGSSILFPYGPEPLAPDAEMSRRIDLLSQAEACAEDQLEDYRRQLKRMSEIVGLKLSHSKKAFEEARRFAILCLFLAGVLVLQAVVASVVAGPETGTTPIDPAAATHAASPTCT